MPAATTNDNHNERTTGRDEWTMGGDKWTMGGRPRRCNSHVWAFRMFYLILLLFLLLIKYITVLFRFKKDDHDGKRQPQRATGCHVTVTGHNDDARRPSGPYNNATFALLPGWHDTYPYLHHYHYYMTARHHTTPHPHLHHTTMWHHTTMKTTQWRLFWYVFYIFIHILRY